MTPAAALSGAAARDDAQVPPGRGASSGGTLRDDIQILPGPVAADGAPSWTLYDPAAHRFLRIGRLEYEVLSRWDLDRPAAIAAAINAASPWNVSDVDVMAVQRFAHRAGLLRPEGTQAHNRLTAEAAARALSAPMWLLKNYLFIRVRLLDPDRALQSLARLLGWMFTPAFGWGLAGLGVLGLYLIGRRWDAFTHAFAPLFTPTGAIMAGLALAFAKAVHEVGHGLMARRFGCRVPGMGVALLVLWPILWTDVTDAWRLTNRRQRLLIDAAGVLAELVLAVAASLVWSVAPDGAVRGAALILAGSTWLVTLTVNINPLMRFDGYFLLSDWLDEPNLQDRAFAMARWWTREALFAPGHQPPEPMRPARRRLMVVYALACWVYRLGLFLGIALLVYHFSFKLLGIFLMAVEIGWFIVRPLAAEVMIWRRLGVASGWSGRTRITLGVALLAGLALVMPWQTKVSAPAMAHALRQARLESAEPGQILLAPKDGMVVTAGQTLLVLASPDIVHEQAAAMAEVSGLRARLLGIDFDPDAVAEQALAWQKLRTALARSRQMEARATRLTVTAGFSGVLTDVPPGLVSGVWVPRREPMGLLIDPSRTVVEAMVDEGDIARVRPGATARFWPEDGEAPIALTVTDISPGTPAVLELEALGSVNGGPLAARRGADGMLRLDQAVYRVTLTMAGQGVPSRQSRRGTVQIEGQSVSPAGRFFRHALAVLGREAGL